LLDFKQTGKKQNTVIHNKLFAATASCEGTKCLRVNSSLEKTYHEHTST